MRTNLKCRHPPHKNLLELRLQSASLAILTLFLLTGKCLLSLPLDEAAKIAMKKLF
jgi:hypothetical protein